MGPDLAGVELDHRIEGGVGIGVQCLPVLHRQVPLGAACELTGLGVGARCHRPAFDVLNRLGVNGHQAGARARFNGHVAHGHAAFHAQVADGRAGKFDGVARAAGGADFADDGQHDVLAGQARGQLALDLHEHVLGLFGQQSLRGQHMFDLAGADAVGQRAKRAMRGGVRVAADHRHAGQGGAVFRADHMHDALAFGQEGKVGGRAKLGNVLVERDDLLLADRIGQAVIAFFPAVGGRVVVGRGDHGAHAPDLATGLAQALVGLRAGDLVREVAVDVQDRCAVFFGVHDVLVPKLVVECASHGAPLCALVDQ